MSHPCVAHPPTAELLPLAPHPRLQIPGQWGRLAQVRNAWAQFRRWRRLVTTLLHLHKRRLKLETALYASGCEEGDFCIGSFVVPIER